MSSAPVIYTDARDDKLASTEKKEKLALNHFNHFLEGYCPQIGIDIVKAEDIPYHGIPPQEDVFGWWGNLIGAFITYMGAHATRGRNPDSKRLSKGSADQYTSSVKTYLEDRFRNDPPIPVLQKAQWSKLKEKLRGKYREQCRASNTRMVESIESSTREDRECLATGCIWDGSVESAEFWHLLNTSYHCSGRASEVSLISPEDHASVEVNEDVYQYQVLYVDLQRQKDGDLQRIAIYPHRDGILEDYYFSAMYLVVMVGCDNEYVFPRFSKAALVTSKTGKSASRVASLWSNIFDGLRSKFDELSVRINEKLSSHCNKKGSNQVMVESPSVSGIAQTFRTYGTRGRDTIWEYFHDSPVLSQAAGKVVSKWTAKIGDLIIGGQPPTFEDIGGYGSLWDKYDEEAEDEVEDPWQWVPPQQPIPKLRKTPKVEDGDRKALKKFTENLFEDDVGVRWQPKVRELLVMALFLRYEQFCVVLRASPEAYIPGVTLESWSPYDPNHDIERSYEFNTIREHLFICRVEEALSRSGATKKMFRKWCGDARDAFLSRNLPGIPNEKLSLYGNRFDGKSPMMDVRCFADHFNALSSISQSTHVAVQQMRHQLNDITEVLQYERIDKVEISEMRNSLKRLETHFMGSKSFLKDLVTPARKFSISSKAITGQTSVADVTVMFIIDNFPAGMAADQKSVAWKDKPEKERKKYRNLYSTVKRAVRMVLMHMDSYPPSSEKKQFKQSLRKTAGIAEDRIRKDLDFGEGIITIHKLQSHKKTKELETTMELPANTPEDIRKMVSKQD